MVLWLCEAKTRLWLLVGDLQKANLGDLEKAGFGFWYLLLEGWLWLLVFVIGSLALAVAVWLFFWRAG